MQCGVIQGEVWWGEVSGVSYCRPSFSNSAPLNIPPNVHMLAGCDFNLFSTCFSSCFLTLWPFLICTPPLCGGIVLDISIVAVSSAKALPLKSTPHSSFSASPHLTICQHCWLWLCVILYVNIQIQKTRQGNLLVLLSQYVNIIFSGSPTRLPSSANVHCVKLEHAVSWHTDQCQHCQQMSRFEFCVSILLRCAMEDTQWDT